MYGVSLQDLFWRDGDEYPLFLTTMVRIVEDRGIKQQGIYRVPGEKRVIEEVQAAVDERGSTFAWTVGSCCGLTSGGGRGQASRHLEGVVSGRPQRSRCDQVVDAGSPWRDRPVCSVRRLYRRQWYVCSPDYNVGSWESDPGLCLAAVSNEGEKTQRLKQLVASMPEPK